MAKISGPLLDRIDIHIEVPAVAFQHLSSRDDGTDSEVMRHQVIVARELQRRRFDQNGTRYNANMSSRQLQEHCTLDSASLSLMKSSVQELGLSARAHDKVLRVARTIADLDKCTCVGEEHLQEAINYRILDRSLWA